MPRSIFNYRNNFSVQKQPFCNWDGQHLLRGGLIVFRGGGEKVRAPDCAYVLTTKKTMQWSVEKIIIVLSGIPL